MPSFNFRPGILSALVVTAAVLVGCDDPSAVGIGIIGDRGGEPIVEVSEAESAGHVATRSVTGQAQRFLIGSVVDDLLGGIQANAYVDFVPSAVSDGFRNSTVAHAELRLGRNYVFGDTTGTVTVNIYDMPAEWDAADARSDTTFPVSALVTTQSFSLQDSLITLPLPADWVARNDTTLRSTRFSNVFHGLYVEATGGGGVGGFASGSTRLVAVSQADTASFLLSRVVTTIERSSDPAPQANVLATQATAGPGVQLSFDLSDFQSDFSLNRVMLRVEEDSLLSQASLPANYVRPRTSDISLFVNLAGGGRSLVETTSRRDDGSFVFQSNALQNLINSYLQNFVDIDSFELRAAAAQPTLNHAFLRVGNDRRPTVSLTLTPLLD